jgi:hypothetical protein
MPSVDQPEILNSQSLPDELRRRRRRDITPVLCSSSRLRTATNVTNDDLLFSPSNVLAIKQIRGPSIHPCSQIKHHPLLICEIPATP